MVWLCKTKLYRKGKTVLYGYGSFDCTHKTDDTYKGIIEDVETKFNTSNYEVDRTLPKGENEKVIGLMKDELRGKQWKHLLD